MLYIKGISCNCSSFISVSEMKSNTCYDIKTVHQYNIKIWILMISLHEYVRGVGAVQRLLIPSSYCFVIHGMNRCHFGFKMLKVKMYG